MKKILMTFLVLSLFACKDGDSTVGPSSSQDTPNSNGGEISGGEVTASEIQANPGNFQFAMGDGSGWGKFGDDCDDDQVPWVAAWKDKKKMAFDQVSFNMDAENIYLDILTESNGEQSFTVPLSEVHFDVNVEDQLFLELQTLVKIYLASTVCEEGEGTSFAFDVIVKDQSGKTLTPKKELVEIAETDTYFTYSEWSRTLDYESCTEGYAGYIHSSDDFMFSKRASLVDGTLLLEAEEYLEEESRVTHSISLDDPKLEIVKTKEGYSLTYKFDACGEEQASILTLYSVSQEDWENEF